MSAAILAAAAAPFGIRIYKHPKFSEEFFERSDNEALAKLKVPAHTLSVAYEFPDYHAVGDEAGKTGLRKYDRTVSRCTSGHFEAGESADETYSPRSISSGFCPRIR